MKNFAKNLETLEKLTADIKRDDISLEDALKDFEMGIKLARGMEAEIDRIEGKIQMLMNEPAPESADTPELDLFSGADEATGTAGAPQEGANALLAAAQAALAMHGITRHADGVTRINVGVLRAGEGRNVIAPNGYIACETRGETTELNDFMFQKCMDIVAGVAQMYGVQYGVKLTGGTSGGDSSEEITDIYERAARQSPFIKDELIVRDLNFGACEDFAHFMHAVQKAGGKSGYLMIGTKLAAGHHNGAFDFDESALLSGTDVFLRSAYAINGKDA